MQTTQVWQLIFMRLQSSRTPKLARCTALLLSLFACVHGLPALADSIDRVQVRGGGPRHGKKNYN